MVAGLFGGWAGVILRFWLTGLAVMIGIFITLSIIKAAIVAGLRKCVTGWHLKSTPKEHETKPEPEITLLAGARERNFPIKVTISLHLPQPALYTPPLPLEPDEMYCIPDVTVDPLPKLTLDECIQLLAPMERMGRNTL